jgi:ATP-dependent NAD(P)H-hydrate dehydratase
VKEELQGLFSRLHVLVMGPGLGREDYMQKYAHTALDIARERGMYIVCDADALWMVGKHPEAVKGYRRAILTPNVMEFKRLAEAVNVPSDAPPRERAGMISKALGGVLVVQKGPTDLIAFDTTGDAADAQASKVPEGQGEARADIVEIDIEGGLKRCGGQGDVLSGTIGAFLAWGKCLEDGAFGDKSKIVTSRIPLLAAAAGSMVTRSASRRAFAKEGRSVVTQDMLSEVGNAFADVFGDENQGRTAKSKY